jgi:hypothetical protein
MFIGFTHDAFGGQRPPLQFVGVFEKRPTEKGRKRIKPINIK